MDTGKLSGKKDEMLGGKPCSGLVSHPGESSAMKTGISLAGWTTWIFLFFFEK